MTPRTGSPVLDQADADGPERQPVDEVAGAVDRVDRPSSRTAAPLGRILLAGQTIVRVPLTQALAYQLLEVLIEIGHEAEIRLLDRVTRFAREIATAAASLASSLTNSSSPANFGCSAISD